MRHIKIILSNREEFTLPEDKAIALINSNEQLVQITKKGDWTGETINKAHIVCTKVDRDETRRSNMKTALPAPDYEKMRVPKHISEHLKKTL